MALLPLAGGSPAAPEVRLSVAEVLGGRGALPPQEPWLVTTLGQKLYFCNTQDIYFIF